MGVTILQWNACKKKENQQLLLETATEDILAIQEPWHNPFAELSTYCPRSSKYYLIHKPGGKAAIYIHKRWALSQWTYKAEQYWCKITLTSAEEPITIWSIYNPPDYSPPTF